MKEERKEELMIFIDKKRKRGLLNMEIVHEVKNMRIVCENYNWKIINEMNRSFKSLA